MYQLTNNTCFDVAKLDYGTLLQNLSLQILSHQKQLGKSPRYLAAHCQKSSVVVTESQTNVKFLGSSIIVYLSEKLRFWI